MQKYVHCYMERGFIEEEKLYVLDIDYALLLEYDLNDWTYRCVVDFTDLVKGRVLHPVAIFKKKNIFYLILKNTFRILEYNMMTNRIAWVGEQEIYEDAEFLILDSFLLNDKIWIFPCSTNENVCFFDIGKREFTELPSIMETNLNSRLELQNHLFNYPVIYNESLYLPIFNTNCIWQLSETAQDTRILELEEPISIHALSAGSNEVWFSETRNPWLYCWKDGQGIMDKIRLEDYNWKEEAEAWKKVIIREIVVYQEKLVIIPYRFRNIRIINQRSGEQKDLLYPSDFQIVQGYEGKEVFSGLTVKDKWLYLYPCSGNGLLILNMDTEELRVQELKLSEADSKEYYQKRIKWQSILYEHDEYLLADYIKHLRTISDDTFPRKLPSIRGERIYAYLSEKKK